MKKTLLCGALIAALAMTSCSKKAENAGADESSEACEYLTEATVDSISEFTGKVNAMRLLTEYNQLPDSIRAQYDKAELVKGYQEVVSNADNNSYLTGLQMGMRALGEMSQVERMQGIKLNKKVMLNGFKSTFMRDSLSLGQMEMIENTYKDLQTAAAEARQRYTDRLAQANMEAGQQYVDSLMQAGANLQKTADGLYYKVAVQGDTALVSPDARVKVKYVGKFIDGKVFDSSENTPDGTQVFSLRQVVKGFAQGIELLGVGGKGTLYIPGTLGYGPRGTGDIGPDQMLIFDVEVVQVVGTPATQAAAKPVQMVQ